MKGIAILLFGLAVLIAGYGRLKREESQRSRIQGGLLDRQVREALGKVTELERKRQRLTQADSAPSRDEDLATEHVLLGVDALRAVLAVLPRQRIPELQLLTQEDWILVAAKLPVDPTQDQLRDALKDLQHKAKDAFVAEGQEALRSFLVESHGKLPDTVRALAPYFETPVPEAVINQYQIMPRGTDSRWRISGKESSVEGEWDNSLVYFGTNGSGSYEPHGPTPAIARKDE